MNFTPIKHFLRFKMFFLVLFSFQISVAQGVELGKVFSGSCSYYATKFHNRKTANGELMNNLDYTCAHPTLPFGTMLEVTNLKNGKSVIVRVNDRGPYSRARVIDVSYGAAKRLGMIMMGVIKIKAKIVGENGEVLLNTRPESGLMQELFYGDSTRVKVPFKNDMSSKLLDSTKRLN